MRSCLKLLCILALNYFFSNTIFAQSNFDAYAKCRAYLDEIVDRFLSDTFQNYVSFSDNAELVQKVNESDKFRNHYDSLIKMINDAIFEKKYNLMETLQSPFQDLLNIKNALAVINQNQVTKKFYDALNKIRNSREMDCRKMVLPLVIDPVTLNAYDQKNCEDTVGKTLNDSYICGSITNLEYGEMRWIYINPDVYKEPYAISAYINLEVGKSKLSEISNSFIFNDEMIKIDSQLKSNDYYAKYKILYTLVSFLYAKEEFSRSYFVEEKIPSVDLLIPYAYYLLFLKGKGERSEFSPFLNRNYFNNLSYEFYLQLISFLSVDKYYSQLTVPTK